MNKYPKIHWTNEYFTHICKSFTAKRKIHSAESEKSSGAEMRKSSVGKSPKTSQKWEKMELTNGLPRARTDVSTYIWQLSKSSRKRPCALPERYTMRPSRPAFRQKGNLSPHSLANRKPQNRWESFIFLHGPTRPQMDDSHGEKLTFWHSGVSLPRWLPTLIHKKYIAFPAWYLSSTHKTRSM